MAEDMVERVAVAIYNASSASEPTSWEAREEYVRDNFRAMAIDAIEAMREPTTAMLWAGDSNYETLRDSFLGPAPVPMWRAMIDAALSESTTDATIPASNSR